MQPLTIPAYNRTINIPPPPLPDFDIRSFKDNMGRVPTKIRPFRTAFFQIAILESGGGRVSSDGSDYDLKNCTLFFNLSTQIIYWDIRPDWRGYYCCLPETSYTSPLARVTQRLRTFSSFSTLTRAFHEITMYYPMRVLRENRYKLIVNFAHQLPYPFASDLQESKT